MNRTETAGPLRPPAATRERSIGMACLIAAVVFWGLNIPMTSSLLAGAFDSYWLATVRVTLATIMLGVVIAAIDGPAALRVRLPIARWATLSGVLAGFFILYNLSLTHTHPITAAALQAGSPVYAAVLLKLVSRAPLERGFWGAAALTVIGAGIAVFGRPGAGGQGLVLTGGEPLVVLSLIAWTLYSYLSQRWFPAGVAQLQRTFASMLGAIGWLFAAWAVLHALGRVGPPQLAPDLRSTLFVLITALLATAGGTVAWNIGVNRTSLALASLWQNTVPVWGVLFSLAFGIEPNGYQLVGGAVVLSGVLYMQWLRWRTPAAISAPR